jgi:orotidine-5'-phosphate decarboxylase
MLSTIAQCEVPLSSRLIVGFSLGKDASTHGASMLLAELGRTHLDGGIIKVNSLLIRSALGHRNSRILLEEIVNSPLSVFVDLKVKEVPGEIDRILDACAEMGARKEKRHSCCVAQIWLTVSTHTPDGLRHAVERTRTPGYERIRIIAVGTPTSEHVRKGELDTCTQRALSSGAFGIICDGDAHIRRVVVLDTEKKLVRIVPGIRAPEEMHSGQLRVSSIDEAIRRGAHYLVVGSRIMNAPYMDEAYNTVVREMELARNLLKDRGLR